MRREEAPGGDVGWSLVGPGGESTGQMADRCTWALSQCWMFLAPRDLSGWRKSSQWEGHGGPHSVTQCHFTRWNGEVRFF